MFRSFALICLGCLTLWGDENPHAFYLSENDKVKFLYEDALRCETEEEEKFFSCVHLALIISADFELQEAKKWHKAIYELIYTRTDMLDKLYRDAQKTEKRER